VRMFIPHEVMSGCANHCSCLTGALQPKRGDDLCKHMT
jgi:hypothetical protein